MQAKNIQKTKTAGSARDRARGALLGLAAGDAVGTTVEFRSPGTFAPLTGMAGGGPFHLKPGQWTDDTSMALCLAESLVDLGGHDPADQLRRYALWWKEGYLSSTGECFDIGTTTRNQLARFLRTHEPEDPNIDEDAAANGSLMRLAPVAIRWAHAPAEVVEQAAASSRTTHPASRPVDACRLLAAMTAALIRGEDRETVLAPEFWQFGTLHPEVEAVARGSWRTKQPPAIRGTGYCVEALEAAIWAVAGTGNFQDAILRAANLGDDADTTAAIAGQLAGAMFGANAIPEKWLAQLAMRTRIESLADALHDASLGERHRWAFDDTHHAWWIAPGQVLAGEYPGRGNSRMAERALELLADVGIDTIFDLTHEDGEADSYDRPWRRIGKRRDRQLRRIHHPIGDFGAIDGHGYRRIVRDIEKELAAGRAVYIHCWAGIGRTGTVVGVWLRHRGLSADEALEAIREARVGTKNAAYASPQTDGQRAAIRNFVPWASWIGATKTEEA